MIRINAIRLHKTKGSRLVSREEKDLTLVFERRITHGGRLGLYLICDYLIDEACNECVVYWSIHIVHCRLSLF
jgi:hypothetical protein